MKESKDTKAITNRGRTVEKTESTITLRDTDNVVDVRGDALDSFSRYRRSWSQRYRAGGRNRTF